MELLELRQEFVKKSGRYDLVTNTTTWPDNGANFYINAGQRMLTKMLEPRSKMTQVQVSLDPGEYEVDFQATARVIKNVYVVDADGAKVALTFKNIDWIIYEFGKDVDQIEPGVPYYWTYKIPSSEDAARKIHIVSPVSETCIIETHGYFMPANMSADNDESWWAAEYPEILLKAALYQLEVFYRNTEGAKDWMSAIQQEIQLIDFEDCADISAQINQMEG